MYEDNDMRKDDSFTSGSYYDTGSSYTHYDSAEAMKQPKKPKKKGGFGRTVASAWYWRWCSAAYPGPRSQESATREASCWEKTLQRPRSLDNGFAYHCIHTEQRCI